MSLLSDLTFNNQSYTIMETRERQYLTNKVVELGNETRCCTTRFAISLCFVASFTWFFRLVVLELLLYMAV
jgi:hypothetical protein